MPAAVEHAINSIRRSNPNMTLQSAIRILKAKRAIKQKGKHLAAGPSLKVQG